MAVPLPGKGERHLAGVIAGGGTNEEPPYPGTHGQLFISVASAQSRGPAHRAVRGSSPARASSGGSHVGRGGQPGSSTAFSFAVLGDWGKTYASGNPDQANVMTQIAASGARFVVATGDTGYPAGS